MSGAAFTLGESFEEVEINLYGEAYTVRPITRTVTENSAPLAEAIRDAETGEDLVKAAGKYLDYMLECAKQQRKPSAILIEKWEADKLRVNLLMPLVAAVTNPPRPT